MASKNTIIWYLFIQITLNLVTVDCDRLNTLKVLLPIFNDVSTNFTLEADEGCYRWSTARLDIIQITPIDYNNNLDCSNKAIVSSITKERTRNNALIIAENVYTSQYLQCDVIVDVIHALKIITRTRELLLEEDPVKLEVRAYDKLGNEFSSLLGIEFSWTLLSLGPTEDFTDVLTFVKFNDSLFKNPAMIDAMEADNKRGNIALIKGLKTGSAKISVSLPHEEYGKVVTDEVQFSVIANLILMPPDVYIMMGDIITFKVFYLTYGDMEEIILPNKQYYLKTEDDIAVVNQESSKVTGIGLGKTRVVLYNRNVVEADPNMKMPAATINVVEAKYLRLSELPYKNWAKFIYKPRDIITAVFTKRPHKFIDDNEQSEQRGNYSTLHCAVRGNQTSRITNQKANDSNVETEPRYRVFIDGTLQIISLYKTSSGIYLCTVDNKVGRPLSKEINLKIRALVTAAINVGSGVFQIGRNINIACKVDGHPYPEVRWFKDNDDELVPSEKIQIESHRLIIHQANQADSGTYKCEAYNEYSRSYSSASIKVEDISIDPNCTDNPHFANCELIVRGGYCSHRYYARFCCKMCTQAEQNTCHLQAETGECANYVVRWNYNTTVNACRLFYYGGCGGNGNNFNTVQDCIDSCVRVPTTAPPPAVEQPKYPEKPQQRKPYDVCNLSHDTGSCSNYTVKVYFNKEFGRCEYFFYGGCDGNGNRFSTIKECENICFSREVKPNRMSPV